MAYRIQGLSPEPFRPLAGLSDEALARLGAVRVTADSDFAFPCRITLEDARPGETLILVNHVSLDSPTPYRASHAIFVREDASEPGAYVDELPPVFARRTLSLRGFDSEGMMRDARLALPGEAEAGIAELFADPGVESIHVHSATRGCFVARVERN